MKIAVVVLQEALCNPQLPDLLFLGNSLYRVFAAFEAKFESRGPQRMLELIRVSG